MNHFNRKREPAHSGACQLSINIICNGKSCLSGLRSAVKGTFLPKQKETCWFQQMDCSKMAPLEPFFFFFCLWKTSEWQFSVLIYKHKMGSTIMSEMSEGGLLRKEHLCAKEFLLFSCYDILWTALSSDNIRAKQTKNGEKFGQWHPNTIQRESTRFHSLDKIEVKLEENKIHSVCLSMCVHRGWWCRNPGPMTQRSLFV